MLNLFWKMGGERIMRNFRFPHATIFCIFVVLHNVYFEKRIRIKERK